MMCDEAQKSDDGVKCNGNREKRKRPKKVRIEFAGLRENLQGAAPSENKRAGRRVSRSLCISV